MIARKNRFRKTDCHHSIGQHLSQCIGRTQRSSSSYDPFSLCPQREALGMLDDLGGQIDVQGRPIEVPWGRLLDVQDFPDGGVLEPREVFA